MSYPLAVSPDLGWHISWWAVLVAVTYLLALLSIPSVLLQRQGRPQAALSWVLLMFLLPGLGLFLWWAMGRRHLVRRRRRRRGCAERSGPSPTRTPRATPTTLHLACYYARTEHQQRKKGAPYPDRNR